MKIKIPKIFSQINYLKYLPWLLVVIIGFSLISLTIFLNNNYLETKKNINKINQIINLVAPTAVEIQLYNKILEDLEEKQQTPAINSTSVKNPFQDIVKENLR